MTIADSCALQAACGSVPTHDTHLVLFLFCLTCLTITDSCALRAACGSAPKNNTRFVLSSFCLTCLTIADSCALQAACGSAPTHNTTLISFCFHSVWHVWQKLALRPASCEDNSYEIRKGAFRVDDEQLVTNHKYQKGVIEGARQRGPLWPWVCACCKARPNVNIERVH
jgi:hypothetical protein